MAREKSATVPVTSRSAASATSTTGAGAAGSPPTTAPPDTGAARWWLEGNFGPVHTETTATDLSVTGTLPAELTGLYVRNGSNPQSGDSSLWFFGDGMDAQQGQRAVGMDYPLGFHEGVGRLMPHREPARSAR